MKILHLDCSPREESYSRHLSQGMVARLVDSNPGASVIRRDLGVEPIPHAAADYATALSSPERLADGQANGATHLSELLIQEVEAVDAIVIGTPMNNFTVPSVLKAWIDQILRVGRTIGMSSTGEKTGMLLDRPIYIGIASGGIFSGEDAGQPDFITPYLTAALGCVGLSSLEFFPLQGTAFLDADQLMVEREALLATMDLARVAR